MQQILPKCRNLLISRNFVNSSSSAQSAFLHSTPICNEKWKNKWKSDFKGGQQPSKNYARYATRQKRADTKKALWNLLSKYGESGTSFQNGARGWDTNIGDQSNSSPKKGRSKSNSHHAQKIHNHKMRRKYRKGYLSEEDDDYHPETIFQATFGNRCYTWSFDSQAGSSQRSTPGFDWREPFDTSNCRQEWKTSYEPDSEDEAFNVGSRSDRVVLGLPQNGPLKLKDVKNAFHLSALKWHPDKHQGPSQAAAEEKFKLCVNAYRSLCNALSGA